MASCFTAMSEQPEAEVRVFDRVFNAAACAQQELSSRNTNYFSVKTVQMLCLANIQWEASHEQCHAQQFGLVIMTFEISATVVISEEEGRRDRIAFNSLYLFSLGLLSMKQMERNCIITRVERACQPSSLKGGL